MRVPAQVEDPHRLIRETYLATRARISEAAALAIRHLEREQGCLRIEQRNS